VGESSVVRALSLVFDVLFLSSLAIFMLAADEFTFVAAIFVFIGIIVQAILLRQFKPTQPREWRIPLLALKTSVIPELKTCHSCKRTIPVDAKICRFCLTEVDEYPASTGSVISSQQGTA
jgi:hypothetical protein